MQKLHATVYGRVQGVGFRYFVQRNAEKLGIKGWVRNKSDGSVEILAYGEEEKISKLLSLINQGPSLSYVTDVKYTLEKVTDCPFGYFFIKY
ncbi:MAG: acylphosphatase [Brevinematia bacterium]